jgi:hypothetical protein
MYFFTNSTGKKALFGKPFVTQVLDIAQSYIL